MSQVLGALTWNTGLSPLTHIGVDRRPYIALDDHALSDSSTGMAKVVKGVKVNFAEQRNNIGRVRALDKSHHVLCG